MRALSFLNLPFVVLRIIQCHIGILRLITGDSYHRGELIDNSKFGADPGLPAENVSSEVETSHDKEASTPTPVYRCKKCRRVVALQENVVDHVPGEGQSCFEWHKRRSGNIFNKAGDDECSSIFVEPLRWMTTGTIFQLFN